MSNTKSIAREQIAGEEGVVTLAGGALEIDSLTTPGLRYKVHFDSGYCSCDGNYYSKNGKCKHLVIAEAIEKAHELKVGAFLAERMVLEFCSRIFAKIRTGEDPGDAYQLWLDVKHSRYTTTAMENAAKKRHARVRYLHDLKAA